VCAGHPYSNQRMSSEELSEELEALKWTYSAEDLTVCMADGGGSCNLPHTILIKVERTRSTLRPSCQAFALKLSLLLSVGSRQGLSRQGAGESV